MTPTGTALVQMLALVGVVVLVLAACAAVGSALGREIDRRSSAAPPPRWEHRQNRPMPDGARAGTAFGAEWRGWVEVSGRLSNQATRSSIDELWDTPT